MSVSARPEGTSSSYAAGVTPDDSSRFRLHWGKHRLKIFVGWTVANYLWSIVRIGIVAEFLAPYGVSVFRYAIIEICSSLLWAQGSVRAVDAAVSRNKKKTKEWIAFAGIGFIAPEVYLLAAGRQMPIGWKIGIIVFVIVVAVYSARQFHLNVRDKRRLRQEGQG